jgi:hypothetical protein
MTPLKSAARKGRGGDTRLGHLTNGDIILPTEFIKDEKHRQEILQYMKSIGVRDPNRFEVGHASNSKNPRTRLPEFSEGGEGGGGGGAGAGGDSGDSGGGGGGVGGGVGGTTEGGHASEAGIGGSVGAASSGGTPGGIGGGTSEGGAPTGAPDASALAAAPESNAIGATTATGPTVGIGNAIAGLSTDTTTTPGSISQGVPSQQGNPLGLEGLGLGIATDPIGTIASMGLNGLLGIVGGIPGLVGNAISKGITGQSLAENTVGLVEGKGIPLSGPIEGLGQHGTAPAVGPAPPGQDDNGAGLRALGGGVGVDLSDLLRNRIPNNG